VRATPKPTQFFPKPELAMNQNTGKITPERLIIYLIDN
jgi:hypothetical protein